MALTLGLAIPLALLSLFIIIYFSWHQNICGIFEDGDKLKSPLMQDDGEFDDVDPAAKQL